MWFVLYVMVSIIMSTFYTLTIYKGTNLSDMSLSSKICFVFYCCEFICLAIVHNLHSIDDS